MYKALASISSAPPAIAVVVAGALIRNVRPVASAIIPNNAIDVMRAAMSGHIPAPVLVRARERKKNPDDDARQQRQHHTREEASASARWRALRHRPAFAAD